MAPRSRPWLAVVTGMTGSGKTTLARRLAADREAIRLCPDEWMRALAVDLWDDAFRARLEHRLTSLAAEVLRSSGDVVIEFGSWTRGEREELLALGRAANAVVELHILDPAPDEIWRRLSARNAEPDELVISREQWAEWLTLWQPPTPDETSHYDRVEVHRSTANFDRVTDRPSGDGSPIG